MKQFLTLPVKHKVCRPQCEKVGGDVTNLEPHPGDRTEPRAPRTESGVYQEACLK